MMIRFDWPMTRECATYSFSPCANGFRVKPFDSKCDYFLTQAVLEVLGSELSYI